MRVIDSLTNKAGRIAGDLQGSLRRARVEGEKRLLQRQHRAALEDLGLRVYELVKAGDLPEEAIAAEVAAVEGKLIEIEAKVTELEEIRPDEETGEPSAASEGDADGPVDPALAAFPMIDDAPPAEPPEPSTNT
jgi:predicted transcriptional regulator